MSHLCCLSVRWRHGGVADQTMTMSEHQQRPQHSSGEEGGHNTLIQDDVVCILWVKGHHTLLYSETCIKRPR